MKINIIRPLIKEENPISSLAEYVNAKKLKRKKTKEKDSNRKKISSGRCCM